MGQRGSEAGNEDELRRLRERVTELESANRELERVKAALDLGEFGLVEMYENMPQGMAIHHIVCDDARRATDYVIDHVNPAYEKITGIPREEAEGRKASKLYGSPDAPYLNIYAKVVESGESTMFQVFFPPLMKHFSVTAFSPGKDKFITIFSDISRDKYRETQMQKLHARMVVIRDINQMLLRVTSEEELWNKTCRHLVRLEEISSAWIGLLGEGNPRVRPVCHHGKGIGYLDIVTALASDPRQEKGPTGMAIKTKAPYIANDIATDPCYEPAREEALKRGYLSALAVPLIADDVVIGAITVHSSKRDTFTQDEVGFLQEVAGDVAMGIRTLRLEKQLSDNVSSLIQAHEAIVHVITAITEKRDQYTAGHQTRVAQLSAAIGKEMELEEKDVESLRTAATIHDIGKIVVPAEILNKPGKLSDTERLLIHEHVRAAYDVLREADLPSSIAESVYQHHERLDGSGYPRGLKEEDILLEARIIGVTDVIEAMCHHRPYRPALGIEAALEEIENGKGTLYDETVVNACVKLFREEGFQFDGA